VAQALLPVPNGLRTLRISTGKSACATSKNWIGQDTNGWHRPVQSHVCWPSFAAWHRNSRSLYQTLINELLEKAANRAA
jgi:hypothetical protein